MASKPDGGGDPPRVLLHMPVDVRSASLAVLAVLACVYTLQWASAVFIPSIGSSKGSNAPSAFA